MARSLLAVAVERKHWSLVALCLLVAIAEEASRLPPETLDHLIELLEVPEHGR
jgi:hypothetical protein